MSPEAAAAGVGGGRDRPQHLAGRARRGTSPRCPCCAASPRAPRTPRGPARSRVEVATRAARRRGRGRCCRARSPSSSIVIEPKTISSLWSPSTSATDRLWLPWPRSCVAGDVGVERPPLRELRAVEVVGGHHGPRVVAAAQDEARVLAVEVGDAGEEPVDAVAVRVAPRSDVAARRGVVDRVDRRAGRAVEDREVLRPGEHVARACCGSRRRALPITVPTPSTVPSRGLHR